MIRAELPAGLELIRDHILVRRPALPRHWDSISRPHVAIIIEDPVSGDVTRYYLSRRKNPPYDSEDGLELTELDGIAVSLPDGVLLEVRFNAMQADLYRLHKIDGTPSWRWIGRCTGIFDFDYPSAIDWTSVTSWQAVPTFRSA